MLQELDTGEIDMNITGFDYTDLEILMTQFYVPEEDEKEESNKGKSIICPNCGFVFLSW